jgi:hypothetical protein
MCIIIYKDSGVNNPTEKILKTCLESHKDGFGVMWRVNDKVAIRKGLYTLPEILKIVDKIPKEVEAAFHFRQCTHGKITAGNCHPFPLTSRSDALTCTNGTFDTGLVHNGIISGFGDRNEPHSDTMNFIKYLEKATHRIYTMPKLDHHIKTIHGKFIVFTPKWTYTFGTFFEEFGLKFSNYSYRDFNKTWGCNTNKSYNKGFNYNELDEWGYWDPKLQQMVYKPLSKGKKVPIVCAVEPTDLQWIEGSQNAEYLGTWGSVIYYKGTTIFCEHGYDKVELGFLMEDISAAIAEGEYEGSGMLGPIS